MMDIAQFRNAVARWGGSIALGCAFLLSAMPCHAQSATIAMTADRNQVAVGDTFRVQVRLDVTGAEAPEPVFPDFASFDILSRQVSRPMQFRFGFGGQTQVVQSTVVYAFFLRARQPGRFDLAAARASIAGREYVSQPLTIVVGGNGTPGTPSSSQNPPSSTNQSPSSATPPNGPLDGAAFDPQAFLRTVIDRPNPWLGQQVRVTIYLYVRSALRASPVITREPSTDGFWVHDLLPPARTLDATAQVVDGVPFRVYVLRRFAAFPLRAGDLTIGAPSVTVPVGSVFDVFAGSSPDLERTGVQQTIHVRPLPSAERPAGEVHVGQLALEASVDRNQVPTGDAVTLTLRVTGAGHVQGVRVADPIVDGIRVLSPQTSDQITAPNDVVSGTRVFEWLIVPEREGTYTIPPFRVPTFEPESGRYLVVESPAVTLTAAGNPVLAGNPSMAEEAAPTETNLDTESRLGPIRTESALSRGSESVARQAFYPWLLAAFPMGWLGFVGFVLMRRRVAARAGQNTPKKIVQEARRRLAGAEALLAKGDAREFYAAVSLAMKSVIEGRLGEAVGSLTHRELSRRLVERGMDGPLAKRITEELEGHEMVRFSASGAQPAEMQAALGRARELIGELDRFVARALEDA
jgi:hypothetical protein